MMADRKRPRGTRELIADIFLQHPDWSGPRIYERYLVLLGNAKDAVTLSAVQKILKKLRPKYREMEKSGNEDPWHLGTLKAHPLPPGAIEKAMKVQEFREGIMPPGSKFAVMTIRQAEWIAYLCPVITDIELLNLVSWHYALKEKICQINGVEFDTREYDRALRQTKAEAINYFENTYGDKDWETRRAAFKGLTGYELKEPVWVVVLRGGQAYGLKEHGPEVSLGPADRIVAELEKDKAIETTAKQESGDVVMRLRKPLLAD